jgi:hypothetical protein
VPAEQLRNLSDFDAFKLRKDVADHFDEMSEAMLKAYKARPNPKPGESIGIASTYRNADDDARAWEKAFKKHFGRTEKEREETGDPLGKEALDILFRVINGKKAPPGFSGHTHGIAADMTTNQFGTTWTTNSDYEHQVGWQRTWLYEWLVNHAGEFHFYQLKTETWHWEFHADEPGKRDQVYGAKAAIGDRKVAKPK